MKKIIFTLITVLSLTLLVSCSDKDTDTGADTGTTAGTETGTQAVTPKYTVSSEVYSDITDEREIALTYPVFEGIENAEALNELLLAESKAYMENYLTYNHPGEVYYSYEVSSAKNTYLSDSLASFICTGTLYADGAAHPINFAYTLNVDMASEKLLTFGDIIKDFTSVTELFKDGEFSLISSGNSELDNEITTLTPDDLIGAYSELYGIYPPVYFTENGGTASLALSLETIYALGGHVEFEAEYDKVADALTDEIKNLLKNGVK